MQRPSKIMDSGASAAIRFCNSAFLRFCNSAPRRFFACATFPCRNFVILRVAYTTLRFLASNPATQQSCGLAFR